MIFVSSSLISISSPRTCVVEASRLAHECISCACYVCILQYSLTPSPIFFLSSLSLPLSLIPSSSSSPSSTPGCCCLFPSLFPSRSRYPSAWKETSLRALKRTRQGPSQPRRVLSLTARSSGMSRGRTRSPAWR